MASPRHVPSPFALPSTRRHKPLPLPPVQEVKEKLYDHPEAQRIRSGQLGEWFTTPLVGGEWTEWGKHCDARSNRDDVHGDKPRQRQSGADQ